jgi:tetratricopeptide (TPR) repeat protein
MLREAFVALAEGDGERVAAGTLAASLISEHPNDPDLRRAAVFAAWRGGQWAEALKANDDLLAWLKPRRMDLWIRPVPLSLSKRANRYLAQTKASGMDTQAVLGMSMQYESILEQMLSSDEEPTAQTYESLYQAHQRYRGRLLRLAGDVDGYREHMLAKSTEVAQVEPERPYYDQRYGASGEPVDWRESVRAMLLERGRFEEFIARCEALGARLPIEAYGDLAEAHAALGHAPEAAAWRSRLADLQLAALLAADQPSLSDGRSYSWWWYRGGAGEEDAVRGRLRQVRLPKDDEAPPPRGLIGYALRDPAFESRLVAAAESAGPGWESTRLLDEVVQLHLRQDRPAEVIALLERVHKEGDLVQSPHLDAYLSACAATGDEERLARVLAAVEAFSPRLKLETDLLRMAFARLSGDTATADAIEAECRQRCRRDRPNPMTPDDGFCAVLHGLFRDDPAWSGADQEARWHATRQDSQLHALAEGLPTLARLAAALGVDYDAESGREELTLEAMRDVYDRFGLHADALRIVEMELAAEDLPDRERADLVKAKANLLNDLGHPEEARAALAPVSARLESLMDSPSPAPEVVQQGITLWESEQLGNDPAHALEILHEARRRDPLVDVGGVIEAGLLFRLGRYEDAWESYRQCFDEGAIRYTDTTADLRAGIAGAKAGDEAAQRFLRLGLWRNPFDELAATAKELLQ